MDGSSPAVLQPVRSFTVWEGAAENRVSDTVSGNGQMLFTGHSDDL